MADKIIVTKSKVTALFDSIRNKAGVTGEKTFDEMKVVVDGIETASTASVFTITLTDRYNTSGTVYVLAVEEGMTWEQYINSSYNSSNPMGLHISSGYVWTDLGDYAVKDSDSKNVSATATITATTYSYSSQVSA